MKNVNIVHKTQLSDLDRLALLITNGLGTMYTFFAFCILVMIPFAFPATLPYVQFISSAFLQLVLLPIIMVGQNLQQKHQELMAENDYETNVKAEIEIEHLQKEMEKLKKSMDVVVDHITAKRNADIDAMQQDIHLLQEEKMKLQKENLVLLANKQQKNAENDLKAQELNEEWLKKYE